MWAVMLKLNVNLNCLIKRMKNNINNILTDLLQYYYYYYYLSVFSSLMFSINSSTEIPQQI